MNTTEKNIEANQIPDSSKTVAGFVYWVPDCSCSSAPLADFITELEHCLSLKPNRVTLRFLGMAHLCSDPALVIYDVLQGKDKNTEIVTDARSPLINNDALIWLAGDRRLIRSTGWMRFDGPQTVKNRIARQDPENICDWIDYEKTPQGWMDQNYQSVLKLINKHLPVSLLADRLITPHMLGEYQLVTH